jgi:DNA-binding IclR family transcriptional regulator
MDQDKTDVKVRSLGKAFHIVECLLEHGPMQVIEVAENLGFANSTVHRHLSTLRTLGYVCKDENRYRLGLRFLETGEMVRDRFDIYHIARPKIDQLAAETEEIAQLMIQERGIGARLYLKNGQQGVRTNTSAGEHVHLHTTAAGKAILAHLPADRQAEIIETGDLVAETKNSITDPETLRSELEDVRERGYAFNREERIEGLRAVGVPVLVEDRVVGAISVAGPAKRLSRDWYEEELPDLISGAANEIELKYQYS